MDFNPTRGHEQQGLRPALVVSNNSFSQITQNGAMVCPITNRDKNLPFHIPLDGRTQTTGVILCDQAKILDLAPRNAVFVEKAPKDIVSEAIDTISCFIEIEN
jgi:mRNA interferase MazF